MAGSWTKRMVAATLVALTSITCIAASSGQSNVPVLVSRTDYDVSPLWAIRPIQGKAFRTVLSCRYGNQGDFWQAMLIPGVLRPLTEEAPFIQHLSQTSFMKGTGMSVEPGFPPNNDMSSMETYAQGAPFRVTGMLEGRYGTSADAVCRASTPLIIRDWSARPFPFKLAGSGNKYNYDKADYARWLKSHPNLLTFDMGEWDNEYINLDYYLKVYLDAKMISPEKAKRIADEFPTPKTADDLYRNLQKAFALKKQLYFGDAKRLSFMNAGWNIEHIAAYLGAGMITLETSNSGGGETYYRWQVGMSFARGAARQYSIPWMWYIASCLNGYTAAGEWVTSREPGFDNDNGVGPSWLKRCFYLAYYAGANFMELEHWYLKILAVEGNDYRYSRIGEHFSSFCSFAEKNSERGIPYTPVALLVPFLQCYPQWGGHTTGSYTTGDLMLDAFWATIVPSYDRVPALKRGEQGCVFNSPFGDIYDVVCPDAPEQRNLQNALAAYKVAILLGNVKPSKKLTDVLLAYVNGGGTLVLNINQLDTYFPESQTGIKRLKQKTVLKEQPGYGIDKILVKNAHVVKKSQNGLPLLTVAKLGKGRVVVSMVNDWVPALTHDSASLTRRGKLTFPFIQDILGRLVAETLPVTVKGDIQYGINRTADGYIVYLINNRGVSKMADTAEVVDADAVADVTISCTDGRFSKASELRTSTALAIKNNQVRVTVHPGDVSVVRLYK